RGGSRVLGEGAARRARRLGTENLPPVENHFEAAVKVKSVAEPGEKFMYGPSHFYAFGELLERKLRASDLPQKTVMAYMQTRLFDPIGLKVGWFGKDGAGKPALPGGCLLTAREWAKFGEFVRLNGAWRQADGSVKTLLRPDLLAECFRPSAANPSYGLTWWLRKADPQADGEPRSDKGAGGDGRSARDRLYDRIRRRGFNRQSRPVRGGDGSPLTVHMAAGLGKQRLYVIPERDLVVVRFAEATTRGQRFDDRRFLEDVLGGAAVLGE
ncbi:MAG: serine hydrolase, partial [Phycisphaerales bacterium]